ncbi:hypothetical protein BC835DRAFT_1312173 [Cytidiella melzeri]|nr:hypothetical protein BC835DRAFT_1312173 [Cytidiella melzeri]
MADDNPRPSKRLKREFSPDVLPAFSSQSTLTTPPSSDPSLPTTPALKPLPLQILLLSLPTLLALPPNHANYAQSLVLSSHALRQCLSLPALSPEIECRAWCGLAEIGMRVIGGGFSEDERYPWARDVEAEVDRAMSKATIIAQKHPSLRSLRVHLSLLQVQLSQWQDKTKFARTQIRNLISSLRPMDSPSVVYSAHLAAISLYAAPKSVSASSSSSTAHSSPFTNGLQDVQAALSAVQDMEAFSLEHGHTRITLLAQVLRLRIAVAASMWQDVASAIAKVESALGLSYDPPTTPKPRQTEAATPATAKEASFVFFESPFEAAMAVHALIMTVNYFTHMGSAAETAPRLSHLHALLDSCVLEKFADGTVEVKFADGPPLVMQVTHPRLLFLLGFLVSSVAKRDVLGRKPRRKVFAAEGLSAWDREIAQAIVLPLCASKLDFEEIEQRLVRVKGDLLCELIAVSIMRSEFDVAEQNLNILISHTRTYSIFPIFAARIALHQAHLAHALNQTTRALSCYRIAAHLAAQDKFVRLSAQAGEVIMLMGLESGKENDAEPETHGVVDRKGAMNTARACSAAGGALEAVGQVVEALVSSETLRSKEHLKHSLELATRAQDNYLRAVLVALVAAHYFHTAWDYAYKMLLTCEQLAAGLGAPASKNSVTQTPTAVGNARLGLWVGQKFLELYKRAGKDERVQKQIVANQRLEEAVIALAARGDIGRAGKTADG